MEKLRQMLISVADADTSFDSAKYDKSISPLHLHCGAVSFVVKALYGGEVVVGKINGITHYWNRVNDKEIDLTSCQFGGDGVNSLGKGRKINRCISRRALYFAEIIRGKDEYRGCC